MNHHHGYDFKINQATAKCRCGQVTRNPYYKTSVDPVSRMPILKVKSVTANRDVANRRSSCNACTEPDLG